MPACRSRCPRPRTPPAPRCSPRRRFGEVHVLAPADVERRSRPRAIARATGEGKRLVGGAAPRLAVRPRSSFAAATTHIARPATACRHPGSRQCFAAASAVAIAASSRAQPHLRDRKRQQARCDERTPCGCAAFSARAPRRCRGFVMRPDAICTSAAGVSACASNEVGAPALGRASIASASSAPGRRPRATARLSARRSSRSACCRRPRVRCPRALQWPGRSPARAVRHERPRPRARSRPPPRSLAARSADAAPVPVLAVPSPCRATPPTTAERDA